MEMPIWLILTGDEELLEIRILCTSCVGEFKESSNLQPHNSVLRVAKVFDYVESVDVIPLIPQNRE